MKDLKMKFGMTIVVLLAASAVVSSRCSAQDTNRETTEKLFRQFESQLGETKEALKIAQQATQEAQQRVDNLEAKFDTLQFRVLSNPSNPKITVHGGSVKLSSVDNDLAIDGTGTGKRTDFVDPVMSVYLQNIADNLADAQSRHLHDISWPVTPNWMVTLTFRDLQMHADPGKTLMLCTHVDGNDKCSLNAPAGTRNTVYFRDSGRGKFDVDSSYPNDKKKLRYYINDGNCTEGSACDHIRTITIYTDPRTAPKVYYCPDDGKCNVYLTPADPLAAD